MIFKKYLLLFVFICSCADYNKKNNFINEKKLFSSSGFVLVYSDQSYIDKVINKKIDNNKMVIAHSKLKKYTLVKIINPENSKFVTLKISKNLPKKISLLRLDTDFYKSTKAELKYLFPLLSKGGVLIVDDYGSWLGSKKAVDEYFLKKKYWIHFIDHSARMIIK